MATSKLAQASRYSNQIQSMATTHRINCYQSQHLCLETLASTKLKYGFKVEPPRHLCIDPTVEKFTEIALNTEQIPT